MSKPKVHLLSIGEAQWRRIQEVSVERGQWRNRMGEAQVAVCARALLDALLDRPALLDAVLSDPDKVLAGIEAKGKGE